MPQLLRPYRHSIDTMSEDPAQKKKRKFSHDGDAIKGEADVHRASRISSKKVLRIKQKQQEEAAAEGEIDAVAVTPPDNLKLSSAQKIVFVDLQKEDGSDVQAAMTQLDALCNKSLNPNSEEHLMTIRAGGLFAIVSATMRKWYANLSIQRDGCAVLMRIFLVYKHQDKTFRKAAVDSGAIDAVVWSLQNYLNDSRLQYYGLSALGAMLLLMPTNAKYVADTTKVHNAVAVGMQKFPGNSKLQAAASIVLHELMGYYSDATKKQIEAAGGHRALCDALENHRDESEQAQVIQKYARAALKKLL